MWFEIIPSFCICSFALALPVYALHYMQLKGLGTPYKRYQFYNYQRTEYLRDERLTGDAYVVKGLDSLPDK